MIDRKLASIALTVVASARLWAGVEPGDLHWTQLPPLPDPLGVAGTFAGVSHGTLLVAGGANFPSQMPWEGGKKVWQESVYALSQTNGTWQLAGHLPLPLAYGVSLTTPLGVLCIGGSDANRHHAETFLLDYAEGTLRVKKLSPLPTVLANAAGALAGSIAYVACGSTHPGEQAALNRFFALDLAKPKPVWRELPACPGEPRILPVAGAANDSFYLAGGAALRSVDGKVQRIYLSDAWRYTQGKDWERLADLPKPRAAAASPAPIIHSAMIVMGGDDGSLAGVNPLEKHPGFPASIQELDLATGKWTSGGELPAPRATLPVVEWNGLYVLPSGEVRPGVRSSQVWALKVTPGK